MPKEIAALRAADPWSLDLSVGYWIFRLAEIRSVGVASTCTSTRSEQRTRTRKSLSAAESSAQVTTTRYLQALIPLLLTLAPFASPAATNRPPPVITVTAARSPRVLSEVPSAVTLVGRDAIASSPARNVDDVLRTTHGISLLRSVGIGYGLPSQVNIRGVPSPNGTLLLLDGMPMNEAGTGFLNLNEVPMRSIRQVEVVRGPGSALYGADAFGGVINVLTLDPGDVPALDVSLELGNEAFRDYEVTGGWGDRTRGAVVALGVRSIDNTLARSNVSEETWDPATGSYRVETHPAVNYDYADTRLLFKVTHDIGGASHLDVQGRLFESELGYGQQDRRPLYPRPEDATMENRTALLGAVLTTRHAASVRTVCRGWYRTQERELWGLDLSHVEGTLPVFVRSRSETDTRDWHADGRVELDAGDRHQLLLGMEFNRADADFSPLRDAAAGTPLPLSSGRTAHVHNTGAYAQDEFQATARLRLVAGLRADSHSTFHEEVSPRAGLVYRAGETTHLRASAGRAFRAPSLSELYQPALQFGSVVFESNPDLQPETIVSADAGIEQAFGEAVTARLNVFYNDMDDLITTRADGDTLTYANTDEAWSAGLELGLDWAFAPYCALSAAGTLQDTEERETGRDLAHIPDRTFGLGLRLGMRLGRWLARAAVDESYYGERGYVDSTGGGWREQDAYWRTDLAVQGTFDDRFRVACRVQNLFDTTYQEWPLTTAAPGRLYAMEVGVSFP